jgi:hypothetical protein
VPKFDDVTNPFCSSGGGVIRRAEARLFQWRGVSRRAEARFYEWRGVSRREEASFFSSGEACQVERRKEASFFVWRGVSPPSGSQNRLRSKGKDGVNKNNFLGWLFIHG